MPTDSPLLRRPDLLAVWLLTGNIILAIVSVSGMFIGPTSQAPRVDEGRMKSSMNWKSPFNKCLKVKSPNPGWLTDC